MFEDQNNNQFNINNNYTNNSNNINNPNNPNNINNYGVNPNSYGMGNNNSNINYNGNNMSPNMNPNQNQKPNPNFGLNNGNNNGNNNKKINKKVIKPVIILVILLIVILTLGTLIYFKIKDQNIKKKIENNKKAASDPIILVNSNKENTKLTLKVEHTDKLSKIVYAWNEDSTTEHVINNIMNKEYEINNIDIPLGTNTFYVIATDENGVEGKYKNEFTNNLGEDIGKPKINLTLEKRGKNIKVNVKDNNALKKVTYRWNDDKEHSVELQGESQSEVSFNVKIIPGKNKFKVYAEDSNGNITTRERDYEGIEAPTLNFTASTDGKAVILKVFHPLGVKSIEYKLNGEIFRSDDIKGNLTTVEVTINLTKENNEIEAKATSVDGVTSHPEVRSIKMREREEVDLFGERVTKDKEETETSETSAQTR